MGNFDVTTPAGSDLLSQGDDKIRELKLAIRESLRAGAVAGDNIEGIEAVFPGSAPSTAPVYRYRGLKGTTAARPASGQYGLYFDTDRKVLQRDNGTSWEDIGQMVLDSSITEAKLSTSVAGNGLSGGANNPLTINAGDGLELDSDYIRVASSLAGNGLSGGSGSPLAVNVDNSTIGISSDTLFLKDDSVSSAKLTPTLRGKFVNTRTVVSSLIQNDGSFIDYEMVAHTGQGRLLGIALDNVGNYYSYLTINIDGTVYTTAAQNFSRYFQQIAGTTLGFTHVSGGIYLDKINVLFSNYLRVTLASHYAGVGQTHCHIAYEKNV